MSTAAKQHDANYAAFAASMLLALAAEEASVASFNANVTRYQGNADTTAATVRPNRKAV